MASMLPVGASTGVANHPVLSISPVATLLEHGLVDAKEVGEAVVALAFIKVGIKLGTFWRRRCGWHFGDGESLTHFCCEVENFALVAKPRWLSASHQACDDQGFQIGHIAVPGAGKEAVSIYVSAIAAIRSQSQRVPEQAYLRISGLVVHGALHADAALRDRMQRGYFSLVTCRRDSHVRRINSANC